MPFAEVERNVEALVGLPVETIRKFSPGELRRYLEKKNKRRFSFLSEFPVIGRGNVLRDDISTSKKLNKNIDKILTHSK